MRTRERMKSIRKQSLEQIPRESIWFYSEGIALNSSSVPEKKPGKHVNMMEYNGNNSDLISKTPERSNYKKECSYVVDWQLSDGI
jgi:hypothetical protein